MKKPLLLFILAAGVFLSPAGSWAQIPEMQTPSTTAPVPAIQAPVDTSDNWMQYKDAYVGEQNDLANPNRTVEEILSWSQEVATESLTLNASHFNEDLLNLKEKFIPQAWQQYSVYLRDSKIIDMIQSQGYTLTTIIDGEARMLDQMPAGGTYHWLVDAPLLISFTKNDPQTGRPLPAGTAKFRLTMQLGRVQDNPEAFGVKVENWKIEQTK